MDTVWPQYTGTPQEEVLFYRFSASMLYVFRLQVISPFIVEEQHGFVDGKSTVTNLCTFQYAPEVINGHGQVDVLYTDISKAFDRIDHAGGSSGIRSGFPGLRPSNFDNSVVPVTAKDRTPVYEEERYDHGDDDDDDKSIFHPRFRGRAGRLALVPSRLPFVGKRRRQTGTRTPSPAETHDTPWWRSRSAVSWCCSLFSSS
ncbi:hypothetical protein Trydic_g15683 [Trypoxylus dichotomus]